MLCSATTPRAGWTKLFFYKINTHVKISTKKKGTQSENEDGTNSFGVHSQTHGFDKTFFIYSKNIDR